MVHDDFVLYESAAINLYLAEKAGSDLAGRTTREKYEILQWMFWSGEQWRIFATLTFDEVLGKKFMNQPSDETIVKLAADKIARLPRCWTRISRSETTSWATG
ncbi:glutathione S-transferase family protein [Pseudoroseomonas wenyumeiae]